MGYCPPSGRGWTDGIIGRDTELAAVDEFLAGVSTAPGVLLLEGAAGESARRPCGTRRSPVRRSGGSESCRAARRQQRRNCRSAASMTCSTVLSERCPIRCRSRNVRPSTPCCCADRAQLPTRGRYAGRCWRPCGCSPVRGRSSWRLTTCSGSTGRRSSGRVYGASTQRRAGRGGACLAVGACGGAAARVGSTAMARACASSSGRPAQRRCAASARAVAPRAVTVAADPGSCSRDLGRQPVLHVGDRPCRGRDEQKADGRRAAADPSDTDRARPQPAHPSTGRHPRRPADRVGAGVADDATGGGGGGRRPSRCRGRACQPGRGARG